MDPTADLDTSSSNLSSLTFDNNRLHSQEWINAICEQVIKDMNDYGICVINNFLGLTRGESILEEVKSLYNVGVFRDGQLVSNRLIGPTQIIRGDKIFWVNGTEPQCINIGFLIQTLDNILIQCNNMDANGYFSKCKLSKRTRAMIACYPGSGTHYVKHIDNPNGDGRRVTSIYYLNKDWNVQKDGGLLRMYPDGCKNHVADIAPIFDRVIFFWSDRRNPHEVQPAYSIRFAITVWYFDNEETNQAIQNIQKYHNDSFSSS